MLISSALATALRNRSIPLGSYLLEDTFTTDRATGTIDATVAEPGPGLRWVQLDTNAKLSLSGGNAVFAVGGAANDPALRYRDSIGRVEGRIVIFEFSISATGFEVGIDDGTIGSPFDGVRFTTTVLNIRSNTGTIIAVGAFATATTYRAAIINRASGAFYFIKGGAFTNWTLLWMSTAGTSADWYPVIVLTSATGAATLAFVRVPNALWLPSPVLSDGFSSWGTSDGLGHFEAQIGELLGLGGSGLAWTANVGSWGASGGVAAATALTGGRAIATINAGKADLIITVNCTLSSGTMSLIVRWVDENNHVRVTLTSTNCQLVKVVAGTPTTVSDVAYTYSAGAELRIICQGSEFRRFYNNAAVGAAFTIADTALQSPTVVGLRTDNTGNQFDNLRAYARGTGSEFVALDSY